MDSLNGADGRLPDDGERDKDRDKNPSEQNNDANESSAQFSGQNDSGRSRSTGVYQVNDTRNVIQQNTVYYNINIPPEVNRIHNEEEPEPSADKSGDADLNVFENKSAENTVQNNLYTNTSQNVYSPFYGDMYPKKTGVSEWYKKPSVTVPKGYNPYRDDLSVYAEVKRESRGAVKGPEPLDGETIQAYNSRCYFEWDYSRSAAKKKLTKSTNYLGLVLLLEFLLSLAISVIISVPMIGGKATPEILNVLNNIAMILQFCMLYPVLILTANIGQKHKMRTFFHKPQMSVLSIIKWAVAALGLTYIVSFIFEFIFNIISSFGIYVNDLSTPVPTEPLDIIIYGLAVVIGAPIFEEVVFRGILLTHQLKHGCWHAAIVSGLLFGLFHQNHSQMFFAAALGVLFAFIDIKAGSIIPSIIAHMVVNGFSFINVVLMSFTNYNELLESGNLDGKLEGPGAVLAVVGFMNVFVFLIMAAAVVIMIVEIAVNRKQFLLPKGDSGLTVEEKTGAFFRSPAMIIIIVLLFIMVALNSFIPISS